MTLNRAGGVFLVLVVLWTVFALTDGIAHRIIHHGNHLKEKVITFNGKQLHCITDQGHIATCDWVRYHDEGS